MKAFLKNIALFAIPLFLILFIAEVMLPPTLFTFRTWEAVKVSNSNILLFGPFYPKVHSEMIEVGDLAHHTKFAVKKNVVWRTDELGFRNDHFISSPDILIIGDSNIAGSSLSQEETLASVLNQCTGLSVYSLAPANINTYIGLRNAGFMETPQILILSSIERGIPSLPLSKVDVEFRHLQFRLSPLVEFFAVPLQKLYRANSLNYLRSRTKSSTGNGIQSTIDDRMFFLQGSKAVLEPTDSELDQTLEKIYSYKNYCDLIGCKFIFLPIPNKETIFWDMAGIEKQPTFILQFNQKLERNEITTIDTVTLFDGLRNNEILPYHYDDSHWNKYAVKLVAKEIAQLLDLSKKPAVACQ